MLAYVFSHRPLEGADVAAYEDSLRRLHAELAGERPKGFVRSTTYRFEDGYSDWYLVESSAALDFLNQAAVTGARSGPHDAAARLAAWGAGKLMSLAEGEPHLDSLHEAAFAKPAGMAYADLYAIVRPFATTPGAALWRRMMVLGPPPEFCLVSSDAVELPAELASEKRKRCQI